MSNIQQVDWAWSGFPTAPRLQIESDLKDILIKFDHKLDKLDGKLDILSGDLTDLKVGQARLEGKILG
jgi:hypothetical protein